MLAVALLGALRLIAAAESEQCGEEGMEPCMADNDGDVGMEDTVTLLQVGQPALRSMRSEPQSGNRIVLMHIPFNFGHTVERVALLGGDSDGMVYGRLERLIDNAEREVVLSNLTAAMQPGGRLWGHFNPDLSEISNVTGCPLYWTPQKHWPQDLLQKYFGDNKVFGVLRDPYERLVAMFRGNVGPKYGGSSKYFKTCDVNSAVRQMLEQYKSGSKYAAGCVHLPQAEYFDGPYGVTIPVDNREFPDSANAVLSAYGHSNMLIKTRDIIHVTGCTESWANDLDCETRRLVKEVYARDFELLCTKFGYCDTEENTCLHKVPQMCPGNTSVHRKVC